MVLCEFLERVRDRDWRFASASISARSLSWKEILTVEPGQAHGKRALLSNDAPTKQPRRLSHGCPGAAEPLVQCVPPAKQAGMLVLRLTRKPTRRRTSDSGAGSEKVAGLRLSISLIFGKPLPGRGDEELVKVGAAKFAAGYQTDRKSHLLDDLS